MRLDVGNLKLFGWDLSAAWRWWQQGLREALPAGWTALFVTPAPRVLASVEDDCLLLSHAGKVLARLELAALEVAADGALEEAVRASGFAPGELQLDLQLPVTQVLQREVEVPATDPSRLRDLLRWQLPRLTPFSADQLYFAAAPQSPRSALLLAVPCAAVDPLLADIERLTGQPVARLLAMPQQPGTGAAVNLFAQPRVSTAWWRRLNGNALLAGLLVLALGLAALAPVWAARTQVLERKQAIFRVHAEVVDTLATRDSLQQRLGTLNAVTDARRMPPLAVVISELTDRVPDNIYLTELEVQGDSITLAGNGHEVVELIDLLNASPLFAEARFTSSVTRNQRTGRDQFTASLQLLATSGGQP